MKTNLMNFECWLLQLIKWNVKKKYLLLSIIKNDNFHAFLRLNFEGTNNNVFKYKQKIGIKKFNKLVFIVSFSKFKELFLAFDDEISVSGFNIWYMLRKKILKYKHLNIIIYIDV